MLTFSPSVSHCVGLSPLRILVPPTRYMSIVETLLLYFGFKGYCALSYLGLVKTNFGSEFGVAGWIVCSRNEGNLELRWLSLSQIVVQFGNLVCVKWVRGEKDC
ncbi:hypothetical protein SDJN02_01039, partial [Cucurbita argyrosperma subsp. argyrosperma]